MAQVPKFAGVLQKNVRGCTPLECAWTTAATALPTARRVFVSRPGPTARRPSIARRTGARYRQAIPSKSPPSRMILTTTRCLFPGTQVPAELQALDQRYDFRPPV